MGMSFGSFLIVKLSQVAPDRVNKAILLCPAGFTRIMKKPGNLLPAARPIIKPSPENVSAFFQKLLLSPHSELSKNKMDGYVQLFQIIFGQFYPKAQIPYPFSKDELEKHSAPTLVLIGEDDNFFNPHKVVERAVKLIPNLWNAEILPKLGHALENQELVTQKVSEFLESVNKPERVKEKV
jgi:pimeloyl-ACP methyl ester carboxylesterase